MNLPQLYFVSFGHAERIEESVFHLTLSEPKEPQRTTLCGEAFNIHTTYGPSYLVFFAHMDPTINNSWCSVCHEKAQEIYRMKELGE